MSGPMTGPVLPRFERARIAHEQRSQRRASTVGSLDLTTGHWFDAKSGDLRPGMLVTRSVYSHFLDREELVTDVVASVIPRTTSVPGVSVTWSDGTSCFYGRSVEFPNSWAPRDVA